MKIKIIAINLLSLGFIISSSNVFATDQIVVTGTVPASIGDYQQTLESLESETTFAQSTVINYQITYSSTHTASTIPLIIKAQWTQGTIEGEPTPSIDILEYVVGSGSNAYGATPPVIDTVNRSITWTIPNFPANTTDQTVTWQLKTTNTYAFAPKVNFTVSTNLITPTFTTASQSINQSYLHNNPTTPTPTPTPTSSPTPGSTQTNTPTPTSTPQKETPIINSINISSISTNFTDIILKTNFNPISTTIFYGTNPNNLNQKLTNQNNSSTQKITLSSLNPKTIYYFKIITTANTGASVSSDIFTFTTSSIPPTAITDSQSITITSNGLTLYDTTKDSISPTKQPTIFANSPFKVSLNLKTKDPIKQITLIVRPSQILGINTEDENKPYLFQTNLTQNLTSDINIQLKSPSEPGLYEVILRIYDSSGNLYDQKITDLKVLSPLIILDKKTKLPIEKALIKIYLFNPITKIFEALPSTSIIAKNPQTTGIEGIINFTPLSAKFRFEISALNYQKETIDITISDETSIHLDPIFLKQESFSIAGLIDFYKDTGQDLYQNINNLLIKITSSRRYLGFSNITTIIFFILLTLLSFKYKTHIKPHHLPRYLIFHLHSFLNKSKQVSFITATIKDSQTKKPISQAQIFIIDKETEKTIYTTHSNRLGHFHFSILKDKIFDLKIYKQSYQETSLENIKSQDLESTIEISPKETKHQSYITSLTQFTTEILGSLFEALLLTSFILEVLFLTNHNVLNTLPFVIISLLNFIIWTIYTHQKSLSQH